MILKAFKGKLVIELIPAPLELAISGDKFAKVSLEEVESISLEEQRKYIKSSS